MNMTVLPSAASVLVRSDPFDAAQRARAGAARLRTIFGPRWGSRLAGKSFEMFNYNQDCLACVITGIEHRGPAFAALGLDPYSDDAVNLGFCPMTRRVVEKFETWVSEKIALKRAFLAEAELSRLHPEDNA